MEPYHYRNTPEYQRMIAEKREKRKVVTSALALGLSLALLIFATSSFAWFSHNEKTNSDGMSLKTTVTPNLIISKSADALSTLHLSDVNADGDTAFSVVFKDGGRSMMDASTRDPAYSTTTFLKYITNSSIIGLHTGLPTDGSTPIWAAVPASEDNSSSFYIDYVVYLAAYGAPLTNVKLVARLEELKEDSTKTTSQTHKAASIDFYVTSVSVGGYRGTLNLAGINPDGTARTEVQLTNVGSILTPGNENTPICVIMRCYFDGALLDPSKTATPTTFVNTYTVNTDQLSLGVFIDAVEDN